MQNGRFFTGAMTVTVSRSDQSLLLFELLPLYEMVAEVHMGYLPGIQSHLFCLDSYYINQSTHLHNSICHLLICKFIQTNKIVLFFSKDLFLHMTDMPFLCTIFRSCKLNNSSFFHYWSPESNGHLVLIFF